MSGDMLEDAISTCFKWGVVISAMLLFAGVLLNYVTAPGMAQIGYTLEGYGTMVLFAVPTLRVAISVAAFAKRRDMLYFAITAIVLLDIAIAIFVVPIIVHA